jgi:hypothetical protein
MVVAGDAMADGRLGFVVGCTASMTTDHHINNLTGQEDRGSSAAKFGAVP